MNLILATLTAALGIAVGPGHSQGHQQYEVIWTVAHCPMGFLCRHWEALEPNYGQALKLERQLVQEGYRVMIAPAPAQQQASS